MEIMNFDDEKFYHSIDTLAKMNSSFNFRSYGPQEAALVISKILEYSKKWTKIYDHSINGDVADNDERFINALHNFLIEGKSLQIVIRDKSEKLDAKIYQALSSFIEDFPKKIEIREASEEFKDNIRSLLGKDLNFAINDRNAYRVELKEASNNDDRSSISNFNDIVWSTKLTDCFDDSYQSCKKISIRSLA